MKLEVNPTVWKCTNMKKTSGFQNDFIYLFILNYLPTLNVPPFFFFFFFFFFFRYEKIKPSGRLNCWMKQKKKKRWESFKHCISVSDVLIKKFDWNGTPLTEMERLKLSHFLFVSFNNSNALIERFNIFTMKKSEHLTPPPIQTINKIVLWRLWFLLTLLMSQWRNKCRSIVN